MEREHYKGVLSSCNSEMQQNGEGKGFLFTGGFLLPGSKERMEKAREMDIWNSCKRAHAALQTRYQRSTKGL